ncbi:MAG: PAN domain-containing protein [Thermoanaerobaculaceae bacterium]|jgi:hypothetical protein|nr:PAN domain-containing protein [Thermoanaerobaculaceae bacterium]
MSPLAVAPLLRGLAKAAPILVCLWAAGPCPVASAQETCDFKLVEIRRRWVNDGGVRSGRVQVDRIEATSTGGQVGITTAGEGDLAGDRQKDIFKWTFDKDISRLSGVKGSHAFRTSLAIDHFAGTVMNAPVFMWHNGTANLRRDLPGEGRFYSDPTHSAHQAGPRTFALYCDWHKQEVVTFELHGVQASWFDLVIEYVFEKQENGTPVGTPGTGPTPIPGGPGLEPGTNRPGGDYQDFDLEEARPELCRDACRRDPRCRAFTYVRPGVQGPAAHCWLKSEVPAAVPNSDCTSGVSEGAQKVPDFPLESGTDRPGSDYRDFDLVEARPERCRAACSQEPRCLAFTYVHPGVQGPSARCWLKSEVPPAKASDCCISGVKPVPMR